MAFADVAVPKWVEAVKQQYGKPETKYACVGYHSLKPRHLLSANAI
jgi:hypothetical protein